VSLLILQRNGLDAEGVWYEVDDPELGIPDDATADEARNIIAARYEESGAADAIRRGMVGGRSETLIIDLQSAVRYVVAGDER
jgi:hypothetical protein